MCLDESEWWIIHSDADPVLDEDRRNPGKRERQQQDGPEKVTFPTDRKKRHGQAADDSANKCGDQRVPEIFVSHTDNLARFTPDPTTNGNPGGTEADPVFI